MTQTLLIIQALQDKDVLELPTQVLWEEYMASLQSSFSETVAPVHCDMYPCIDPCSDAHWPAAWVLNVHALLGDCVCRSDTETESDCKSEDDVTPLFLEKISISVKDLKDWHSDMSEGLAEQRESSYTTGRKQWTWRSSSRRRWRVLKKGWNPLKKNGKR